MTFQAVFKEASSSIVFNYQDVLFENAAADNGASATIGVQTSAINATSYSAFSPSMHNSQSLLWETSAEGKSSSKGNMIGGGSLLSLTLLLFAALGYRRFR